MIWLSEVSQRYAKAFYELVASKDQVDVVLKDFRIFLQVLAEPLIEQEASGVFDRHKKSKIFTLLSGPLLTVEQKRKLIDDVFEVQQGLVSALSVNFLKFLLHKNRIDNILEIITAFRSRHDREKNLIRGQVFTHYDLTVEEKAQVEKAMAQRLKKQVYFKYFKRPSLLGGILIKLDGLLFDGTIANQLLMLKEHLKKVEL